MPEDAPARIAESARLFRQPTGDRSARRLFSSVPIRGHRQARLRLTIYTAASMPLGYAGREELIDRVAELIRWQAARARWALSDKWLQGGSQSPPRSRPRHVRPQRRWDAARIEPRMARPELAPEEQHLAEIVEAACERGTRGLQGSLSL